MFRDLSTPCVNNNTSVNKHVSTIEENTERTKLLYHFDNGPMAL